MVSPVVTGHSITSQLPSANPVDSFLVPRIAVEFARFILWKADSLAVAAEAEIIFPLPGLQAVDIVVLTAFIVARTLAFTLFG